MKRRAIIQLRGGGLDTADTVRAYLPDNYKVYLASSGAETIDRDPNRSYNVWIEGEDVAGWTLDDYVIPRLASGMIYAEEIEYPYD